ncbi:MAG: hypothetical protein AB7Y46_08700 [Armatimonadota bacterium]
MPAKTWDTQADWQQWTLTHLTAVTTPGMLEIAAGYNSGTALSPAYECASWDHYSKVVVDASRPQGTNVYLRFRTATTEGGLASAPWSEYVNGFDDNGRMIFDLMVYILNKAVAAGPWIQFELTLLGE